MKQFIADVLKSTGKLVWTHKSLLAAYAISSGVVGLLINFSMVALKKGSVAPTTLRVIITLISIIVAYLSSTFARIIFYCILTKARGRHVTKQSLIKQAMPANVLYYFTTRFIRGSLLMAVIGMFA